MIGAYIVCRKVLRTPQYDQFRPQIRLAEKVIVSEVEASYDRAAEFTRDYLKRHPEFLK